MVFRRRLMTEKIRRQPPLDKPRIVLPQPHARQTMRAFRQPEELLAVTAHHFADLVE